MNSDQAKEQAAELLKNATRIVAFTGAGISVESGIPAFRGPGGLWNDVDVETFATPEGVRRLIYTDPGRWIEYLDKRTRAMFTAAPNAAHTTLGMLEEAGRALGVVTQNVDGLHEAGGTRRIHKLHGDLVNWRCLGCGEMVAYTPEEVLGVIDRITPAEDTTMLLELLPKCDCGGHLRPSIVLFGEMLPEQAVYGAQQMLAETDCLLIIGTSGVVEPAASLAREVARRGIPTIELNMDSGGLSHYATVSLYGSAGEILPELV